MTRDELNAIIGSESSKRDTLAEVQGEIEKLSPHFTALVAKRDSLLAELAVIEQAKLDFAAPIQPEPEPAAEVAQESGPTENEPEETSDG